MPESITIQDLEAAINAHRREAPAEGTGMRLSPGVRRLADLYGTMIFHRRESMPWATLDEETRALLIAAGVVAGRR